MGMNPKDYEYIDEREAALDTIDKIGWYESLGLTGEAVLKALKNWDMTAEQKANMALAGDMGIDEAAFTKIYAETRATMEGTKAQLNEQLYQYLNNTSLTDEQKAFLYEALKFSQKQYKTGSAAESGGGGTGKATAKTASIDWPAIKAYTMGSMSPDVLRKAVASMMKSGEDIKAAAVSQALADVDKNILLSAAEKAARKRKIRQRYA